jgi:hypothetical protein
MQRWKIKKNQRPARQPAAGGILAIVARSIWRQGIRSSYRRAYWKYALRILSHYALNPPKIWMAATLMISGHHFIPYAREVVRKIEREVERAETMQELVPATAEE